MMTLQILLAVSLGQRPGGRGSGTTTQRGGGSGTTTQRGSVSGRVTQ